MQKNQTEQPEIPNTPIKYVWFLAKEQKGLVFFSVIAATTAEFIASSIPYIVRSIVDSAGAVSNGMATKETVFFWAAMFPIAVLAMDLSWRCSGFLGMRWMTKANSRSYEVLFTYLGKHSHSYFSDRFAGALSSKVTHASDGAQSFYEAFLWNYYSGILTLLFTMGYIATVSPLAAGLFFVLIILLFGVNILLAKYRRPHVVAYAEQGTKARGRLVDTLTNISAVRQYARHEFEVGELQSELRTLRSLNLRQWTISEWVLVTNNVAIAIIQASLIFITISLWNKGEVTTGELVMMVTLMANIVSTLVFIGSSINGFVRRYGEVEEGLKDIVQPYEVKDVEEVIDLTVSSGKVSFQAVDFEFGQNRVFNDFNLTIKPGQRVGLVGHSGAGKTTFVSLLLRQHDVTGGGIMIDGQNIAEVTQDSLRNAIAVVPQEPMLFHRTIRENIAYGKSAATDEEIIAVAKKAQAHDFIASLPEGYNTMVGERGIKLSGGQKQRVAIARAMLKDSPILVLDEATSALDSESEAAIQAALHKLMEGKTVVAIAHRLSTLREMDRIIVMENGSIVEDGSHDTLKEAGGVYQRLWEHQAGGFLVE
jgi:ABC-type multidrug transport system fused ATPase/permease subunit